MTRGLGFVLLGGLAGIGRVRGRGSRVRRGYGARKEIGPVVGPRMRKMAVERRKELRSTPGTAAERCKTATAAERCKTGTAVERCTAETAAERYSNDLPIGFSSEKSARAIGDFIGKFVCIDETNFEGAGLGIGKSLRILAPSNKHRRAPTLGRPRWLVTDRRQRARTNIYPVWHNSQTQDNGTLVVQVSALENLWLKESLCREVMLENWSKSHGLCLIDRLDRCGRAIWQWGKSFTRDFHRRITYWKSRMENTKHRRDPHVRRRRQTNHIDRLKGDDGVWVDSGTDLDALIINYFGELYSPSVGNLDPALDCVHPILTHSHKLLPSAVESS
nr:uncharacterized protein LOC109167502 [Ipomoea batatas]